MNKVAAPKKESVLKSQFASFAIPILVITGILIYKFVLGNSSNFQGGDSNNHPVEEGVGHVLGLIYKGGFIVPILLSLVLMSITFSIERFLTIGKAQGKGRAEQFVRKVQGHLSAGNVDAAIAECDNQRGSVANVVKSSLTNLVHQMVTIGFQNDVFKFKETAVCADCCSSAAPACC
jgi:biopolymer transport protein ExbB